MRRLPVVLSLFLVLFSVSLVAQEGKRLSREAIDSLKNRRILDNGKSVLEFSEYTRDMGVIFEKDTTIVVDFTFTNVSNDIVVITDIATNCGCTSSVCDKKNIEPGESGVVRVEFSPHRRSGTVDTNVFVYTALSATRPVAKLTLLGNVIDKNEWRHLPIAMGSLRLKSKYIAFEQVRKNTRPQVRVACANVGTVPLRLTSKLLPVFAGFATEPVELAPGEEGDIVITIDGNLLPQNGCDSFGILVDGVEGRITDRMLEIKIKK